MPRLRRVRRSFRRGGSPDSRCSTGDPDDLLVCRGAVRDREQESQTRWMMADGLARGVSWQRAWHVCLSWQMADATLLSGQMAWCVACHGRWQRADGTWPVRRRARCGGEGRLGCRCCSAKPCAGADTPRLTAREASGERARLRTSRRAAGSGHRSARPAPGPPMPRLRRVRRSFAEAEAPDSRCQHRRPRRPAGAPGPQ